MKGGGGDGGGSECKSAGSQWDSKGHHVDKGEFACTE